MSARSCAKRSVQIVDTKRARDDEGHAAHHARRWRCIAAVASTAAVFSDVDQCVAEAIDQRGWQRHVGPTAQCHFDACPVRSLYKPLRRWVAQCNRRNFNDGIHGWLPFEQRVIELRIERRHQHQGARFGPQPVQLIEYRTDRQPVTRLYREHRQSCAERTPLAIDERRVAHR
jgi:hypothetical protein